MTDAGAVANARWAEMLQRWAIPDDIVAAAGQSPYFFDAGVFINSARDAIARASDSPSDTAARGALPPSGTVLDVGSGAGAASLRLAAGHIVAVDPSRGLLDAFEQLAAERGIPTTAIEGTWPEVAAQTPSADVVVCHHVLYNVADLAAFAAQLTTHARERVVVEATAVHPMSWMTPYWESLHGVGQPDRPTIDDAIAVLAELDLDVQYHRWVRPISMIGEGGDEDVARIGRRLCLPPERHRELRDLLNDVPPPTERDVVTLWWRGSQDVPK